MPTGCPICEYPAELLAQMNYRFINIIEVFREKNIPMKWLEEWELDVKGEVLICENCAEWHMGCDETCRENQGCRKCSL